MGGGGEGGFKALILTSFCPDTTDLQPYPAQKIPSEIIPKSYRKNLHVYHKKIYISRSKTKTKYI